MNSEAALIRQYAQLAKAGHRIQFSENQFTPPTQNDLNHLLEITKTVGGQIAPTLDRFATVLNTLEHSRSELALAVAGPKASSRLVMSLPILVFAGAGISGIPIFQALVQPSIVWVSLLLGAFMFWIGYRWTSRLLLKATPASKDSGFHLDALAIAVRAGLPLGVAIAQLERVLGDDPSVELPPGTASSGIALAHLLEEQANLVRFEQFTADRLRIQKASVAVLWPLGLTVLPAFVLIAIVPVAAALLHNN